MNRIKHSCEFYVPQRAKLSPTVAWLFGEPFFKRHAPRSCGCGLSCIAWTGVRRFAPFLVALDFRHRLSDLALLVADRQSRLSCRPGGIFVRGEDGRGRGRRILQLQFEDWHDPEICGQDRLPELESPRFSTEGTEGDSHAVQGRAGGVGSHDPGDFPHRQGDLELQRVPDDRLHRAGIFSGPFK